MQTTEVAETASAWEVGAGGSLPGWGNCQVMAARETPPCPWYKSPYTSWIVSVSTWSTNLLQNSPRKPKQQDEILCLPRLRLSCLVCLGRPREERGRGSSRC